MEVCSTTRNRDIGLVVAYGVVSAILSTVALRYSGSDICWMFWVGTAFAAIMFVVHVYEANHPNVVILRSNGSSFEVVFNGRIVCSELLRDVSCVITDGNDVVTTDSEGGKSINKIRRKRIVMSDKRVIDMPIQFNELAQDLEQLLVSA